ncbi:purine nucleosidase [Humitalea rosea]|uniref:Purine nucleosidase n=1 Tax=Humitalea rosea TaxID=990373 RepID=A0A2W7IHY2_9PROT|nr:nucleoside hydrolase [Humitalea rosea]PZW44735.1 purine nucleosidase [Humitalea rosea]
MIPAIIDCDPGTDDAIALFLALAMMEVRLVTVSGGNVPLARTLANARALVGMTGQAVPVVAGAAHPLIGAHRDEAAVHGADGLGGVVLPEGPPATPGIAADAIRAVLRDAAPRSVHAIALAPSANLALALATEPALAGRLASISVMAGAWGEGNWTPSAEYNAAMDPEALAMLLAVDAPVTLVTLDLTAQALVTPARLAALPRTGVCARAAAAILGAVPPSRRFSGRGFALHDPCAVAAVLEPGLFGFRDAAVRVDSGDGAARGRTHIDRWGRTGATPNVLLAEALDADGFFAMLGQALSQLP